MSTDLGLAPTPPSGGQGRILFVLGEPPFPVDTGSRIRTHHFIEAAREQGLELYLAYAVGETAADASTWAPGTFRQVWAVKPPSRLQHPLTWRLRMLFRLLRGEPWEHLDPHGDALGAQVNAIIAQQTFDYVFCRYMATARHLLDGKLPHCTRLVVDLDDVEPLKAARHILLSTGPRTYRRWRMQLNNRLFEAFHRNLTKADAVLVCSEQDQRYVQAKGWSARVNVIPNAVAAFSQPNPTTPPTALSRDRTLLFCGNLAYGPNIEGLLWFMDHVWPRIRARLSNARLLIVGKNPAGALHHHVDGSSVVLHANVPSVVPFYRQATATVAPLLAAGGTRIKILESFAHLRPVVSTTIGAEGLAVEHERHCLIADSPAAFADACCALLEQPALAHRLASEALELVRTHYDAQAVRRQIRQLFDTSRATASG